MSTPGERSSADRLRRHGTRALAFVRRHEHAVAVAFLVAVVAVYFWRLFIGDQLGDRFFLYDAAPWHALAPPGVPPLRSGQGDAATQFYPGLELAKAQLAHGHLPLWNPHIYAGMALAGNMQSALLHPLTWLGFVLPATAATGIGVVLKLLTAGIGTYVFTRQIRVGFGGGLVAAIVFMLSAPLIGWALWPMGTVFSMFPWLLATTDHAARAPSARAVGATGLVVALMIAAGHPESVLLASSAAGIYLVALMLGDRRTAVPWASRLRGAATWVAGHALGALVTAAVLVPFALALRESITADVHGAASAVHLPIWSALLYAMPNAWGNGIPEYSGPLVYYLSSMGYVGIAVVGLAGVALVARRGDPRAIGLAAMALVALMVVFAIPPVSWIAQHVPPYSSGNNVRVLFVPALALAVGAGAGVSMLSRRPLAIRRIAVVLGTIVAGALLLAGVAAVAGHLPDGGGARRDAAVHLVLALAGAALVLAVLGRVPRPVATAVVLLVVMADLGYLHAWNAVLPDRQATPPTPPAVAALQRAGEGRVSAIWTSVIPPYPLSPNTTALYGLDGIQGYDYPQPRRWSNFSWDVLGVRGASREFVSTTPVPRGPALTALRMMNIRWYLTAPGVPNPNARALRPVYQGADATILADRAALPRAFVVGRTRPLGDDAALATLAAGRLDPRAEALVPSGAPPIPGGAPGGFRAARVVAREPDRVTIDVPAGPAGWLVLADGYSDQWKATVDGVQAPLRPANYAAFGLPVGAGHHRVVIELDTSPFLAGAVASAVGVVVMVALLVSPWRRRRRPAGAVTSPTDDAAAAA